MIKVARHIVSRAPNGMHPTYEVACQKSNTPWVGVYE